MTEEIKPINQYDTQDQQIIDKRYNRLFAKVLYCQTGFQIQDLDEIISIVREDFKEQETNY